MESRTCSSSRGRDVGNMEAILITFVREPKRLDDLLESYAANGTCEKLVAQQKEKRQLPNPEGYSTTTRSTQQHQPQGRGMLHLAIHVRYSHTIPQCAKKTYIKWGFKEDWREARSMAFGCRGRSRW